jgi:citronellol/citronellal dehydrogenase
MTNLKNKTIIITAGDRGMGAVMALQYAVNGANIAIIANKNVTLKEQVDIYAVEKQIIALGGRALTLNIDVNHVNEIEVAITDIIARFGGIDVLINNLSTLSFKTSEHVTPAEFDYVIATNVRATFFISQACIPHLKRSANPHIINIAPPFHMEPAQAACKYHLLFSISKYGMSMCTLGMVEELKAYGIAVNSLWPETPIATQTLQNNFQSEIYKGSRWSEIMADAAYEIIQKPAKEFTGNFCVDEAVLRDSGVTDFTKYAVDPNTKPIKDIFLPGVDYKLFLDANIISPPQYKIHEVNDDD